MMNEFASIRTRGSSDPGRAVTGARRGGFLFLLVSLLVAMALVGCGGGEGGGQEASARIFPQHGAPLGTDNGGRYYAGRLVLNEGCLRVEVPPDANGPGGSSLLIWPNGFALSVEDGAVRVVDGNGRITAHVGDHIRLSRATVSYQDAQDQGLVQGTSDECAGPNFLVGDEITAFDPDNEPTELRLSDPDVLFPRQTTTIASFRELLTAAGFGELALNGHCLGLKDGDTIIWPAGFTPHVDQGVVQIRNGAGRTIAKVGDRIAGGGGFSSSSYEGCPGGTFWIHSIKVLPDVEVYFPKQDGTLGTDQEMERFVGKLVLNRKCLEVDDTVVRVSDRVILPGYQHLLIWPDTFTLSTEDDVVGIVDASGRVVARVGDEIQFSAVSVSYQEGLDHGGMREITPACSGPYWVVGDDFAAVPDSESRVPLQKNVEGPQVTEVAESSSRPVLVTQVETKSVPLPETMDDLIGDADIIAVGRVGEIDREVAEGGFNGAVDKEGNPVSETLVPHTYFELELEQVIRDDGTIASGETVLLRMEGGAQEGPVEISPGRFIDFERNYPMPTTGQRRLFVLTRNPNDSYASGGASGLLEIDGDTVKFATYDHKPVPFAIGKTPDEFLAEVQESAGMANGS